MTNSEDPDEMQHTAAFHQGLQCLLKFKLPLGTEIQFIMIIRNVYLRLL